VEVRHDRGEGGGGGACPAGGKRGEREQYLPWGKKGEKYSSPLLRWAKKKGKVDRDLDVWKRRGKKRKRGQPRKNSDCRAEKKAAGGERCMEKRTRGKKDTKKEREKKVLFSFRGVNCGQGKVSPRAQKRGRGELRGGVYHDDEGSTPFPVRGKRRGKIGHR